MEKKMENDMETGVTLKLDRVTLRRAHLVCEASFDEKIKRFGRPEELSNYRAATDLYLKLWYLYPFCCCITFLL